MRNDHGPRRTPRRWLQVGLLAVASVLACGDDASQDDDEPPPVRVCSMGQVETGCTCTGLPMPGLRSCTSEGQWGTCSCPTGDGGVRCSAGDQVRCRLCPGESERRITTCLQGGTYDCSCRGNGAAGSDADAGP